MKNKYSKLSLIISCLVAVYIYSVFTEPSGSLTLLVGSVVLSIIGFICAINGFIKERTGLGTIPIILSSVTMAIMLALFLIMFAMGAGP